MVCRGESKEMGKGVDDETPEDDVGACAGDMSGSDTLALVPAFTVIRCERDGILACSDCGEVISHPSELHPLLHPFPPLSAGEEVLDRSG